MTYQAIAKALRQKMRGWKHCSPYTYGCFNCAMWYALSVVEWAADADETSKTKKRKQSS